MEIIVNIQPTYDFWGNLISYVREEPKMKKRKRKNGQKDDIKNNKFL